MALITLPRQLVVDINGEPRVGARLYVYDAGTNNTRTVHTTKAYTVELSQPIQAAEGGIFQAVYVNPSGGDYKLVIQDSTGQVIYTEDNIAPVLDSFDSLTSTTISSKLESLQQTSAEVATGITPTNDAYPPENLLRFLTPNSTSAATANTLAIKTLFDPTKVGPLGRFRFPNTTGSDIYHFNDIVQLRSGVSLDLGGCTLQFSKTYAVSDDTMGFLTFIRDVVLENGTINLTGYDGTAGINAGMVLRIGGRDGYGFAGVADILDAELVRPQGHIVLRNLRITTSNPGPAAAVLLLGGLRNVIVENVRINGTNVVEHGIYYEFGCASKNGQPSTPSQWISSHATNMVFRNIHIVNCKSDSGNGAGLSLIGAYSCLVENLLVDGAYGAFEFRPGEALFYRPWADDATGVKRSMTLRNIVGQNLTGPGIQLVGAEDSGSGYLAPLALAPKDETDLMSFSLDGFAIRASSTGVSVSGPCDIRNGVITGCTDGLVITDECVRFDINNVKIVGGSGEGIRASFGSAQFSPARKKLGTIRNCFVAGNAANGASFTQTESVVIEACRFGFSTAYDATSETTQTSGVVVSTGAAGVVCIGCHMTVASGGTAYVNTGSSDRGCNIANPRGDTSHTSGVWQIDGVARQNQTALEAAAGEINTTNKYLGKKVFDTTNNVLRIAQGSLATSVWIGVDGSAALTPV